MNRLLTAILSAIILCSCHSITGSGNIVTQTRNLNQFEGVKTSGSIDIEVMNDERQFVKIEADDNIVPYIITKVEDGMLDVHLKSRLMYHNINAKVYVSAPSLTRLIVSGSGSTISKGTLTDADKIEIKVSGSGGIDANIDAPSIVADVSGSGTINLRGRTKDFNSSISGSGDIKCNKLLSENTTVSVTGSGTAHVFASVHLLAKVTGSGDIYYSGNPPSPEIRKTGSGSVKSEN
ncbi:MAG: head GIN domain-containing protein [Chitinophagaceae bacterium]